MTSSYFGQSFGNTDLGYQGQNPSNIGDHNLRAVMWVFRPYENQFKDIAIRPFQYTFDDNFQSLAQEITDTSAKGGAPQGILLDEFQRRWNFSDNIIPSFQPSMQFMASQLSDKYRFILILTDSGSGLVSGNTLGANVGSSQLRRIYTGYFIDEPFNPLTLTDTSRTLNPNSTMVFTHKTAVGTTTEHGMWGSRTHARTRTSEEIINSAVANAYMGRDTSSPDHSIYLMTPENCTNSLEVTTGGYAMAVPGAHGDITQDRGQSVVSDMFEQPTHNVAQIVKGMMRYKDDVTTKGRGMTGRVEDLYADDFAEEMAARNNLGRWMSIPQSRGISHFDLDLHQVYTAQTIDNMVSGQLKIQDFDQPRPMFYETADQLQIDMTNQYSWLIAMVISPLMNAQGLNSMQFVYEIAEFGGAPRDQFVIGSAEPHWVVSHEETVLSAKAVEMELVKGIFRTIYDSKGPFRVEVSAFATGMTVVRLDLIGQGIRCHQDFEIPSCMGGLISPLLGSSRNHQHNAEEITGLFGTVAGFGTGTKGFNEDDRNFMDFASETFTALTNEHNERGGFGGLLGD